MKVKVSYIHFHNTRTYPKQNYVQRMKKRKKHTLIDFKRLFKFDRNKNVKFFESGY